MGDALVALRPSQLPLKIMETPLRLRFPDFKRMKLHRFLHNFLNLFFCFACCNTTIKIR
ncbi:hypothetical protein [Bathymodiolus platifrons methanotrophic gill symbiont]|uniref:hypothetical protein n=1 Tax=Bathymodiolus platifrons methanotrophic gill symbiont TaxID=113268 RepID=UPI001C8D83DB